MVYGTTKTYETSYVLWIQERRTHQVCTSCLSRVPHAYLVQATTQDTKQTKTNSLFLFTFVSSSWAFLTISFMFIRRFSSARCILRSIVSLLSFSNSCLCWWTSFICATEPEQIFGSYVSVLKTFSNDMGLAIFSFFSSTYPSFQWSSFLSFFLQEFLALFLRFSLFLFMSFAWFCWWPGDKQIALKFSRVWMQFIRSVKCWNHPGLICFPFRQISPIPSQVPCPSVTNAANLQRMQVPCHRLPEPLFLHKSFRVLFADTINVHGITSLPQEIRASYVEFFSLNCILFSLATPFSRRGRELFMHVNSFAWCSATFFHLNSFSPT